MPQAHQPLNDEDRDRLGRRGHDLWKGSNLQVEMQTERPIPGVPFITGSGFQSSFLPP